MTLLISALFDKDCDNQQLKIVEKQCALIVHLTQHTDVFSTRFNNEAITELREKLQYNEAKLSDIRGLYSLVKANKLLGKNAFYNFIVSIDEVESKHIVVAVLLQFNILVAAYELSKLDGYEDYIRRAIDDARILFTKRKYSEILEKLSVRRSYTAKYFRSLRQKSTQGQHILTTLASLFDKYAASAPSIKKRRQKTTKFRPKVTQRNFSTIESAISFEKNEVKYTELLSVNSSIHQHERDFLEFSADEKTATRHFEFDIIAPDEVQKSVRSKAQIANAVASNIERREKGLSTDTRYLTRHELRILIDVCMKNIKQLDYGLLFLSLLTGRSIDELVALKKTLTISKKAPFEGHVVIHYKPNLPSLKIDEKVKNLISTSNGNVVLVLPLILTDVVHKLTISKQSVDELQVAASECLTKINRLRNTRLSFAKINNVLSFYLNNIGSDKAEIALLRNKGITQQAGCYYYQVPVQTLINQHQRFLCSLDESQKYSLNDFCEETYLTVGSSLQVKHNSVRQLFYLLYQSLADYKQQGWTRIEELHNYLTIYTLFLLNLATGHRPVVNPYHTLSCFDLIARTVYISDKESQGNQSSRVLKMPSIALEQLDNYISHLKTIHRYYSQLSAETGDLLNGVIKGEKPLFQMIEKGQFVSVTPRTLERFCLDILPLPQNWHRHFVRTWLRNNGAKPFVVDAWMGHIGGDGDPFSRYSGVSMSDLESISTLLDILLRSELYIKPFKIN